MKLGIEDHVYLDSPLHRWEPRYKLVGLTLVIFGFSFVQDLRLLPAMLAATLALYVASRLPFAFLLTRLRYPGFFLLILAFLLPWLSGDTILLRLGPLALRQEGCLELLLIVVKFVSILTLSLVLFGSAPFLTTIKAMRALGLPAILADMTLLSYRYLFEIGGDLQRMQTAMGLRGFHAHRPGRRTLDVLASLAGSILVRSYERSERIYKAMILRGYGRSDKLPAQDEFQTHRRDVVALGGAMFIAACFVVAEITLRGGAR
jgi:cobalt/nickel transport system permease protein